MFERKAKNFADAPIPRHLILELLKDYKRPNDKISELIKSGELVSIKKGLYIPGPETGLPSPKKFVIANHLWGPSYVSQETALSFWGLIPERVYEISSATIKSSKTYQTPIGQFSYQTLPSPYYSFGIKNVTLAEKQTAMVASPEKALCDKIILTSDILLRSLRQTRDFLMEDLRIEPDVLSQLDTRLIHSWLDDAPKKSSLMMLIKTLDEL